MTALLILHYDPQSIYSLLLFNKNHLSSQAHFVENNLLRCQEEKVNPQYAALKHLSQQKTLKGIKVTLNGSCPRSVCNICCRFCIAFSLEDFAQKKGEKVVPKMIHALRNWSHL